MRAPVLTIALALLAGCLGERAPSSLSPRSPGLAFARIAAASTGRGVGHPCVEPGAADADHDGLSDACEDALAVRFAPVVIHSSDESNFPTDVDDFLAATELDFRDDECDAAAQSVTMAKRLTQRDLIHRAHAACNGARVASDGSRSDGKHRTFFLADLPNELRRGNPDTRRWTTYVHSYPNELGGVTLQYWRVYAYNDAFNDHGGDWEGLHVVLDRSLDVAHVDLLGHTELAPFEPDDLEWEGDHVRVYSEGGGHATRPRGDAVGARGCRELDPCVVSLDEPESFVRQETWPGGRVTWPGGAADAGGGLVNVGEKSAPRNGQLFVRYSGIWGSPGFLFGTSGYWGPAFNETSMRDDGFVTAWCNGMAGGLDRARECWAQRREP